MTAKEYGDSMRRMVDDVTGGLQERCDRAEARVAELEEKLKQAYKDYAQVKLLYRGLLDKING